MTLKVRVSYAKVVHQTKAQASAFLSAPPLPPPPSPQPSLPESLSDTVLLDQGLDVGQGSYEVTFNAHKNHTWVFVESTADRRRPERDVQ